MSDVEKRINRYMNRPARAEKFEPTVGYGHNEDVIFAFFAAGVLAPCVGLIISLVFAGLTAAVKMTEEWPVAGSYVMATLVPLFFIVAMYVLVIEPMLIYKRPAEMNDETFSNVANVYFRMTDEERKIARPAFLNFANSMNGDDARASLAIWNQMAKALAERRQLDNALEGGTIDLLDSVTDYNNKLRELVHERDTARRELNAREA